VAPSPERGIVTMDAACNFFQGRGPDQSELRAKGVKLHAIKTTIDEPEASKSSLEIQIHEISTLRVPGVLNLTKPLRNPIVTFEDGWVAVTCDLIHLAYLGAENNSADKAKGHKTTQDGNLPESKCERQPVATQMDLPVPIRFVARQLYVQHLATSAGTEHSLQSDQVHIEMIPAFETASISLRLKCESLRAISGRATSSTMTGLKVSSKWQGLRMDGTDPDTLSTSPFIVSGLGRMVFASIEVELCSEIKVENFGCLMEPIHKTRISFHENSFSLNFDAIHMKTMLGTPSKSSENYANGGETIDTVLGIPINLNVKHLKVQSCIGVTNSTMCLENLSVDCRPPSTPCQNSVLVRCDTLGFRDEESNELTSKGISLQLLLTRLDEYAPKSDRGDGVDSFMVPGLGYIHKGVLKMDEVSALNVAGVGRLVRPVSNSTITLEEKAASVCLETVYLEVAHLKAQTNHDEEDMMETLPETYMLDFRLQISVKRVVMMPVEAGIPGLCMESFQIEVKPPRELCQGSMKFGCSTLQAVGATNMGFMMNGIGAEIALGPLCVDVPDSASISVPGCGAVSEATIKISSISKLIIPSVGSLARELSDTTVVFGKDGILLRFEDIEWKMTACDDSTSGITGDGTPDFVVPKLPVP
jgi:hypothetical protein